MKMRTILLCAVTLCGCTSSQGGTASPSGYVSKDTSADEVEQVRYMEPLFEIGH